MLLWRIGCGLTDFGCGLDWSGWSGGKNESACVIVVVCFPGNWPGH